MNEYQIKIRNKMDEFVRFAYKVSKDFPKQEMYGVTSQLRRAAMSIILNYIEGYARKKVKVRINSMEISYGSIKECKYLLQFSVDEKYIDDKEFKYAYNNLNEIAAMLWSEIDSQS